MGKMKKTPRLVRMVQLMRAGGARYTEISQLLGVEYHLVYSWGQQDPVPPNHKKRLGRPQGSTSKKPENMEEARNFFLAGETLQQLGQRYGVTREAIRGWLKSDGDYEDLKTLREESRAQDCRDRHQEQAAADKVLYDEAWKVYFDGGKYPDALAASGKSRWEFNQAIHRHRKATGALNPSAAKGQRSYDLRQQGMAWEQIRAIVDDNHVPSTIKRAREWAAHQGLPWDGPSRGPKRPRKVGRPVEAYNLAADGVSWNDVAVKVGYSSNKTAYSCTYNWARRNDKPWPPVKS